MVRQSIQHFKTIAKIATLATALSTQAVAAKEMIFGVKAGAFSAASNSEAVAPALGAQFSYEFYGNVLLGALTAEFEYMKSVSDGEADFSYNGLPLNNSDFSVETKSIMVGYRSTGPIYAIARAGVSRVDTEFTTNSNATEDESDTGLAFGVGAGFSLGLRLEVELSQYSSDVEDFRLLTLSAGL